MASHVLMGIPYVPTYTNKDLIWFDLIIFYPNKERVVEATAYTKTTPLKMADLKLENVDDRARELGECACNAIFSSVESLSMIMQT